MIGGRISRFFKSIFSHKYKSRPEKYTNYTTCKWDGVSMSKYNRERLTYRENKWLIIYGNTGSDIRKRGYWKIAQKQLKHLFSKEQIEEHTEFNKSLSGIKSDKDKAALDKAWKTMLATHCKLNHILYQNMDTYLQSSTKKTITTESIPELITSNADSSIIDEEFKTIQALMDNKEVDTSDIVDINKIIQK